MNYESMTDRELDALVAEKVMGFTVLPKWEHCWSAEVDLDCVGENSHMGSKPHPVYLEKWMLSDDDNDTSIQGYSKYAVRAVPRYSRFAGDAFQVVEAMRERGYDYFILDQIDDGSWGAAFGETVPWKANPKLKEWKHYEVNKQPTAPRAIVIAALRALDA